MWVFAYFTIECLCVCKCVDKWISFLVSWVVDVCFLAVSETVGADF